MPLGFVYILSMLLFIIWTLFEKAPWVLFHRWGLCEPILGKELQLKNSTSRLQSPCLDTGLASQWGQGKRVWTSLCSCSQFGRRACVHTIQILPGIVKSERNEIQSQGLSLWENLGSRGDSYKWLSSLVRKERPSSEAELQVGCMSVR